jgi:hypothetical protein
LVSLPSKILGDVTLQAHLGSVAPAEHAMRYRQAVALIATLQKRGAELEGPGYLPYGIAFDVEKLTWEMDFFTNHFIEAYRGVVIRRRPETSCGGSSDCSSRNSPPSRGSSATATITAAT